LDIGGAYGRYAYPLSKIVKNGKIISFEPGTYSFLVLSCIKAMLGMKNVHILKKALGKQNKKAFLISPIKKTGRVGYSLSYINDGIIHGALYEEIEVTTIDAFFRDSVLERLDFIKCDAEGSEMTIFHGGEITIQRYRPIVLSEVDRGHLKRFGNTTGELEAFFRNICYMVYRLQNDRLLEVSKINRDANYFFIPAEKTSKLCHFSSAFVK
jgi:FkbM family methyltransferase